MKPFDIELAKQGKPVCLRNGRKARIICFDVKNSAYPIIALVEDGEYEVAMYFNERGGTRAHPSGYDLMMAPEKKTGWVNIYKGDDKRVAIISNAYNTKEKALNKIDEVLEATYITTRKIEWEE